MKKIYFILTIIFLILTFVGAGYVLINKGEVNAGFAVVPMLFAMTLSGLYARAKKNVKK